MKCLRAHFDNEENPFGSPYDLFTVDGQRPCGELRDLRLRPDGTVVELCILENAPPDIESRLDEHPDIVDFDVGETSDGGVVCHVHLVPNDDVRRLLELVDEHDLLLDTPIRLTHDGVVVNVLGNHTQLTGAVSSLPESFTDAFCVEGLSDYEPVRNGVRAELTHRQREVLETAVESGYYDIPRQISIEELATELECSPSTVSEHLRKVESRVLTQLR
ncbi:helix-turn-helix domain-containing protein [Haloferax mediterranei ATCC 33500]|uniref:DNA-binding protein n=1 Tax=Haloferax mediterranei (strain ATCC 33500 / DSM 1411 / JCM 8866 / NBRC 14739 / NCIMB 2177 / R-4) TaxID=523841 RepID=I3R8X0_HALMT|nr:helix-turn-helix domain-containing protein [Haloferax mediterranei]AFK20680.1 HTH DNA binding domain-containing protein [Haloferax mediterranei ATCC 33500]AHZ22838.1 DNA-binding protein [Haloferax mediterranei ATCC 33500]EMA03000.1 HTH DNA binding domain-containing protein [Haloferax mediterranei ATCC 33500]MDX5987818.1 helix-turn-helix domain-containing protein [Haloferax mediterranei ATCC 33500]QCQ74295.1 helix-turn-helix domain-containing protein [Haloferax mediterranei ATCC 33500]